MRLNNNIYFVIAVVLFVLTSFSISYMVVGIKDDKSTSPHKIEEPKKEINYDINVNDLFADFTNITYKAMYKYEITNENNLDLYLKNYNEEYLVNGEIDAELDKELFNYKVKEVKINNDKLEIVYYGLLKSNIDEEGILFTNNADLNLSLNEIEDNISEIEYLENIFKEKKNEFLLFKYSFDLNDEKYSINNFEILNNLEN